MKTNSRKRGEARNRKVMSALTRLCVFATILSHALADSKFFRQCFFTPPQCPNRNITFHLYTRDHQTRPMLLDVGKPKSIARAKFVDNRPLIVLLHGYTGDKDYAPNSQLRPAYFQRDDFNIISVDYSRLAQAPCYLTAVSNLPTVANCTAQLLDHLIDENFFTLDAIHVIGFSLGAQTAGMIANYMRKGRKLKRITGLDPAKPLFVRAENDRRIDYTDAEFVDIIHTDVFDRGLLVPLGHVDFYVNGGFNQPGCYRQTEVSPGSCNHERAPRLYAESINSELGFWGFRCAHWYLYVLGFCKEEESDGVAEMGYNVDSRSRGLYFVTTNNESPYARGRNASENTLQPVEAEEGEEEALSAR